MLFTGMKSPIPFFYGFPLKFSRSLDVEISSHCILEKEANANFIDPNTLIRSAIHLREKEGRWEERIMGGDCIEHWSKFPVLKVYL